MILHHLSFFLVIPVNRSRRSLWVLTIFLTRYFFCHVPVAPVTSVRRSHRSHQFAGHSGCFSCTGCPGSSYVEPNRSLCVGLTGHPGHSNSPVTQVVFPCTGHSESSHVDLTGHPTPPVTQVIYLCRSSWFLPVIHDFYPPVSPVTFCFSLQMSGHSFVAGHPALNPSGPPVTSCVGPPNTPVMPGSRSSVFVGRASGQVRPAPPNFLV